ncbi:MAG: lyase [Rhodospirillales bacterium CG15_BIG_FIL_POST_REV_8_21_14_020_66_15]|nr:MAG: lyase [Rhodospirillales bacterium CG15_BIG_FIL_POST_REV_8_21_14_020_66_15]
MIDHVSIAVSDLARSAAFYEAALAPLGLARLVERPRTVGFGKRYPEFWLNARPGMAKVADGTGAHICLRARTTDAVVAFHAAAVATGGRSDGAPGMREASMAPYFAAFIRDPDGNRIEAATFLNAENP